MITFKNIKWKNFLSTGDHWNEIDFLEKNKFLSTKETQIKEEEAKPLFHAIPPPCLRMSSIPPRNIKLMDSPIH